MTSKTGANAKPRMTRHQAHATKPDLTAFVGASAGTGKTHVLTARVLRLMLTGTRAENILCLTFTKAAAAEMTTRIYAELGRWVTMADADLTAEINRRTEEVADDEMLVRARQLFAEVLDIHGGMKIQTFHSFCQSLLGRFPLEAGISPGFEGMEEDAARDIMVRARDTMLAGVKAGDDDEFVRAVSHVAGLVTEQTFDEIFDRLSFLSTEVRALSRAVAPGARFGALEATVYKTLDLVPGEKEGVIVEEACRDDRFDRQGLTVLMKALLGGNKGEKERGSILAGFLAAEGADRERMFSDYSRVLLTASDTPRKTIALKGTLTATPELEDIISTEQSRLIRIRHRIMRARVAAATHAVLTLAIRQMNLYAQVKSERGLLDFDDMIDSTVTLLSTSGIAPWVLYKLDDRIDHILVDEAQDTNAAQWQVVETLAAEFFAGQGARDVTRTVFAVGDEKQSIFSFQKADPKQFVEARKRIFDRAEAADMFADSVPLNLSFRSGEAVLRLVDAVFHEDGGAAHGLMFDGQTIRHEFLREGHGGRIELWPLETPADAENPIEEDWQPPIRQEDADDTEDRAADRIADKIRTLLDQRHYIPAKGRAIRAGDIMVLVRKRGTFVDKLVSKLKTDGIPVAGRDRIKLKDELPVEDLVALGRFTLLPQDDLTLATVLKGPFVGVSEEQLFDLSYAREGSLWDEVRARAAGDETLASAFSWLRQYLNLSDVVTPFEFFSHLLVEGGGRRKLVARLGEDVHDPVDEFLAEALRFESLGAPSLQAFLHHVEGSSTDLKRDMEAQGDSVRVMTVHSSKGLQAPVVFLADTTRTPSTAKDGRILPYRSDDGLVIPLWASAGSGLPLVAALKDKLAADQMAEYRRLLYVALTRAEDHLYIVGWHGRQKPAEGSWSTLIEAGFDRMGAVSRTLDDGRTIKEFEVPHQLEIARPDAETQTARPVVPEPGWLHASVPVEPDPVRPLAPSRPDDDEPGVSGPLIRRDNQRFARGTLIHSLLEWLPDVAPGDREAAARTYLAQNGAGLAESDRTEALAEVMRILAGSGFGLIFGEGSRAEVLISGTVHGRVISGQVDRLLVTGAEVLIIDYKTNRPPPKDAAETPPLYLKQMALYRAALAEIYPGKKVRAALLWTYEARLMELPESLLDQTLEATLIG